MISLIAIIPATQNTGGRFALANESGKRYFCKVCSSEFIVTTAGDGSMSCCGEQVEKK
tara:strand:- start:37 stop:210 length:174 start_codon:yes stop_codon:yes gene_type:complete